MVARTEQARWHGDRWFGHATTFSLSVPSIGAQIVTRRVHPDESRSIFVTLTGNASGFGVLLTPLDVRQLPIGGPYFTIWNAPTSVTDLLMSDGTISFAAIQAGKSAQIYLVDNSTAVGTWVACDLNGEGVASGVRTFLT